MSAKFSCCCFPSKCVSVANQRSVRPVSEPIKEIKTKVAGRETERKCTGVSFFVCRSMNIHGVKKYTQLTLWIINICEKTQCICIALLLFGLSAAEYEFVNCSVSERAREWEREKKKGGINELSKWDNWVHSFTRHKFTPTFSFSQAEKSDFTAKLLAESRRRGWIWTGGCCSPAASYNLLKIGLMRWEGKIMVRFGD